MNITFYQPQVLISLAFLFLLLGVLLVKLIKPLNKLLEYGKNTEVINESPTSSIVNFITGNLVVPKQWFTHFYICLFTLATASYFKACHEKIIGQSSLPSVTFKNISIIHKLLWIQGGRRMVESFAVTKFSSESKINFSHYVVGMAHYVLISLATYYGLRENCSTSASLTIIDYILISVFGISSAQQFVIHYHLAHLRKYSLPRFTVVASPHYLCEIVIYTVFLLLSIKDGFNEISLAFLSAWSFVVLNLSITSLETYKYYKQKYREEFRLKWAIIPGVL